MPQPLTSPRGLLSGARFLAALPSFYRRRFTLTEAQALHDQWLSRREARFLDFVRRTAFHRPGVLKSLIDHAGITDGDLSQLLAQEGLEGALEALFHAGVYATVDEFKGRTPVVRGSLRLDVTPESFRNPLAAFHIAAVSGGSRSAAAPFLIDLDYVRASGVVFALYLNAYGLFDSPLAVWEAPGAGARFRLLKNASFGEPPAAWFTPVDPADPSLDPVFRISNTAMRLGSRLAGVRLPPPTLADGADPLPVARWCRAELDRGRRPHWLTHPSAVVRLSNAAVDAGVDLNGGFVTLGGEPISSARLQSISKSGLVGLPRYGSMETGPIGYACGNPEHADEVHVVRDLHGLIRAGKDGASAGLPEQGLLVTSFHPAVPYAVLNLSMGDQAEWSRRECGCPLSALGWTSKLHDVRSFEKLTAAGITFPQEGVERMLEQILPARFGGGPGDYQLVESESPGGDPILKLTVHPHVGDVEAAELREVVMTGLGDDSPVARVMQKQLESFATLEIERRPPYRTRTGKTLHLHVESGLR